MNLLILGPQGSGKGTQADKISKEYNIPHISTGDLFRENIKNNTPLGIEAKKYTDGGDLVPDEVTNKMVEQRLLQEDCQKGWLLDGFPRNLDQLGFLLNITKIDAAIDIEISDDESIQRISGRLVCKNCGAGYHINYKKPKEEGKCDVCEGELVHRADDQPEAIIKRLQIYHKQTTPILDELKKKGFLLIINGSQTIDEVFSDIKLQLKSRF